MGAVRVPSPGHQSNLRLPGAALRLYVVPANRVQQHTAAGNADRGGNEGAMDGGAWESRSGGQAPYTISMCANLRKLIT
eukprot:1545794-Rhodomonas_salina.1